MGIGCVYFGYSNLELAQKSTAPSVFLENLKNKLEKLENISNITSKRLFEKEYGTITTFHNNTNIHYVPLVRGGRLSFSIDLPFRIQEEIFERVDVEHFNVDIIYAYDAPLFVVSYECEEKSALQPSKSVALLRKYLEKKLTNKEFVCNCIGPSPFHANFFIEECDSESIKVNSINKTLGYDEVIISTTRQTSIWSILFKSKIETALSKFYYLQDVEYRIMDIHYRIKENVELLFKENPKGFFSKIRSYINQAKYIDDINQSAMEEAMMKMTLSDKIIEIKREGIIDSLPWMEKHFIEFHETLNSARWELFSDLAKFFEDRRQHFIRNISGLIAGITGGVIGALIGSIATVTLTSSSDQAKSLTAADSKKTDSRAMPQLRQTSPLSQPSGISSGAPLESATAR